MKLAESNNCIKVSVIVPVYNVAKYLPRCLDSLKEQTLKEIEIICINDGSSDESGDILNKYAGEDDRFVIIEQENKGVSAARNRGIELAKGEYIAFVDSDDYVDIQMCEDVYSLSVKTNADIAVFGGSVFTEEATNNEYLTNAQRFFEQNLTTRTVEYANNSVCALCKETGSWPLIWNKFYKRELISECGSFSTELALGEDEAFLFDIFPLARKIVYTEEKYYHYLRNRPESATDKIVLNFVKRAESNLKMAEIVYNDWARKDLIKKYENEYLSRYIDLLFDSVNSVGFDPVFQLEYARNVLDFFNRHFENFSLKIVKNYYSEIDNRNAVDDLNVRLNSKQAEILELQNQLAVSNGKLQAYSDVQAMVSTLIGKKNKQSKQNMKNRKKARGFENTLVRIVLGKSQAYQKMNSVLYELYNSGYLAYNSLKKRFGNNCAFFSCAAGGIGDAYITACFAQQIALSKGLSDFVILLCGRAEKAMIEELFPQFRGKCILISVKEHEWLRNFDRMCNGETDFFFFHHFDYMQPHLQISKKLQGYKKINMKEMYLWRMGLPLDSAVVHPENTSSNNSEEIEKLFTKNNLKKGRTVVLSPYSTCLGKLSEDFWEDIIAFLKSKQYTVCTNCAPGQEPLKNTKAISPKFDELIDFLNVAQAGFIGYRSGLCDVVSSSRCRQIVLHPYRSTQWGTGNSLNYVGISNMGLNDNVIEIELPDKPEDAQAIKEKIMDYFK